VLSQRPDHATLLRKVYDRLFADYGPQHWWPAKTKFEVIVGAVLTQNTAWTNVVKAIANLEAAGLMSPAAIRAADQQELARLIFSSGYYNMKARKLKAITEYIGARFNDDIDAMSQVDLPTLRRELLAVHGIGEETADDILVYAAGKPSFVIDTYTRRLLHRLGIAPEQGPYDLYQGIFHEAVAEDTTLFGEYHGLIVRHAKVSCRKEPVCEGCVLADICARPKASGARRPG